MPHKMTVIIPDVFKVRKINSLVLEKRTSLEWIKQNPVSARRQGVGFTFPVLNVLFSQALDKSLYFATASFVYRLTNTEQKGYALSSIFTLENVMKFHQTNTIT